MYRWCSGYDSSYATNGYTFPSLPYVSKACNWYIPVVPGCQFMQLIFATWHILFCSGVVTGGDKFAFKQHIPTFLLYGCRLLLYLSVLLCVMWCFFWFILLIQSTESVDKFWRSDEALGGIPKETLQSPISPYSADRKSTRLNSSHPSRPRMPSSA